MVALRQMMDWLLNLIVPGAGLIVRRREWLGLSLAVVFGLCGNVALAGCLIAPAAIPGWLTILAFVLAGLTWLAAQVLFWRQDLSQVRCAHDLSVLLREARSAMDIGDLDPARICLDSAMAMDDENVELHILRARLLTLEGDGPAARKAWRRAAKLDVRKQYRGETERALETLRSSS
jgi:hypothetical protein